MVYRRSCSRPRLYARQSGFTLIETLAALVILAFAAILIGELVRLGIASQERTGAAIREARAIGFTIRSETVFFSDNQQSLPLSQTKPTLTSDCLYDVVGRRCR